jgi:hypothetical protein
MMVIVTARVSSYILSVLPLCSLQAWMASGGHATISLKNGSSQQKYGLQVRGESFPSLIHLTILGSKNRINNHSMNLILTQYILDQVMSIHIKLHIVNV